MYASLGSDGALSGIRQHNLIFTDEFLQQNFLSGLLWFYVFNSVQTLFSIKTGQQLPCFTLLSAKLSLLSVKIQ